MAQINEEKYQNVILYLCSKLDSQTLSGKKKLAKLLYYADFDHFEYKESMASITGDTYTRLPMGPVPDTFERIVESMQAEGLLHVGESMDFPGQTRPTVSYRALAEPDLDVFSADERFILERVARKYGRLTGKDLQDLSHREAPWVGVEQMDQIPFELSFYRGTDFSDAVRVA